MKTTRLLKYYALKLKRSKGSPHSIAGGIAVGTFVGLTPTMPFHTALIVILCIITRTSIVIAVAVSWLVCNPLTYLPIYYFSARLGNTFTPYSLQMSKVREIMEQFQLNANFMDILSMILEAGFEALIVMLAGGVLIGLPAGIVTYYLFVGYYQNEDEQSRQTYPEITAIITSKGVHMATSYRKTQDALKENRLAPKKKFGQNFLVNRHTAEAIVRAGKLTEKDTVIEVGVGFGALTQPLAQTVDRVIGFEIDSGIVRYHQQEKDLPDNVTLVHQDILKADFQVAAQTYGSPLKILANLPYSISNPFIFKLIDNHSLVASATLMLQKEVGDRLLAEPGNKSYGVPTVLLNSCARVYKIMNLKPEEFHPRPKIDSVVVTINFLENSVEKEKDDLQYDFAVLKKIVRSSFNQRRKTLQNSLAGAQFFTNISGVDKALNKELTRQAIQAAQLSPGQRPENLSVGDFITLSSEVSRLLESFGKTV